MSNNKDKDSTNFFDIVSMVTEDDTNNQQNLVNPDAHKGMLDRVLSDSKEVVGSFGSDLRDPNQSIASKMANIQKLEEVALAESIKAFDTETLDERRLFASQHLLKIASTLKGTITHKHKLELMESVDFTNPKISKAFSFFLELFIKTLSEQKVDSSILANILETLEIQLYGFETVLQELFIKVPISEVSNIKNPFTQSSEDDEEIEAVNIYETKKKPKLTKEQKRAIKDKILAKRKLS